MLAPGARVEMVANGVDLQENRPLPQASDPANGKRMFVGQMGWCPNRDGVDWFLREAMPRILAARPQAEFVLVGKADGLDVPATVASRVTIAGFVPDLRPLVHATAVYIVPVCTGSGT